MGAQIAKLREDRTPYTQEAAAAKLRVAIRTYQSWELGEAVPRYHNREKLAKLFKITVEELSGVAPSTARSPSSTQLGRIEQAITELAGAVAELSARLDAYTAEAGELTELDRKILSDVEEWMNRLGRDIGRGSPRSRAGRKIPPAAEEPAA